VLHLVKLAVGCGSRAELAERQARRGAVDPPLRHQTRSYPRRADEVVAGGSIYWVIGGVVSVRQRITAVIEDRWDDGSACAGLVLDPLLVPVQGRAMRPFQGWRYLEARDAPADLTAEAAALPPRMAAELRELGLL